MGWAAGGAVIGDTLCSAADCVSFVVNWLCRVANVLFASLNSSRFELVMSPLLSDVTALFRILMAPLNRAREQLDFVLRRSGCQESVSVVRTLFVDEISTS